MGTEHLGSCLQGHNARTGAEVITLDAAGGPVSVATTASPIIARTYASAVLLPTGEVVHIEGAATAVEFSDDTAILQVGVGHCDVLCTTRQSSQTRFSVAQRIFNQYFSP